MESKQNDSIIDPAANHKYLSATVFHTQSHKGLWRVDHLVVAMRRRPQEVLLLPHSR